MPDKVYSISVNVRAVEHDGDKSTELNSAVVEWPNLPYEGLVAIQTALVGFLEATTQFGYETAKAKGVGEKLEALVGKK